MKATIEMTIDATSNGVDGEMDVTVVGDLTPFRPGRRWGENACPDEGGEVEILEVFSLVDGRKVEHVLSEDEEGRAEEMLREAAGDQCDDEDPPEPDYDRDDGGEPRDCYAAGDDW